jgi:hypothetical protein
MHANFDSSMNLLSLHPCQLILETSLNPYILFGTKKISHRQIKMVNKKQCYFWLVMGVVCHNLNHNTPFHIHNATMDLCINDKMYIFKTKKSPN